MRARPHGGAHADGGDDAARRSRARWWAATSRSRSTRSTPGAPRCAGARRGRRAAARGARPDGRRRPAARRAVERPSFSIAPGEILGIAGVEGNGQTELHRGASPGCVPSRAGSIALGGRDLTPLDVRARGDAGLSHIPEDRHAPRPRARLLRRRQPDPRPAASLHARRAASTASASREHARAQIAAFDIRPADPVAAGARAVGRQPAEDRHRARDGRATSRCCSPRSRRAASTSARSSSSTRSSARRATPGKAVLLVSADLAEVLALSDRIAVMYGGRFVALLPRARGVGRDASAPT